MGNKPEIKEGEMVRLDEKFANSSIVLLVKKQAVYSLVESSDMMRWWTMTNRLTPIKTDMTPTNPTTQAVKSKEEIIYPLKNYLGYPGIPDYLRSVVTVENCKKAMELYATQQQSIATGEIREENELLKKEIELLRSIIGGIHKNVLDIKYSSAIKPFLHFATYVEEVTNLPQPPTKVKGE